MVDEVASLGFAVDSKPIDEATQRLTTLSDAAKKAGISIDELTARMEAAAGQVSKTNTVTQQLENIVSKTGVSYGAANAYLKEASLINNQVAESTGAVGAALGIAAAAANTHGGAIKALASEHRAGGAAMTEYREIVHSVGPALEGLGVQLSTLTQFSYAARGGIAVLAAAAGGALLVAMGKSRDEIEKMNFRLEAFAGQANGAKIGDDLKKASDAAGVMPSQIAPAVDSVNQLQNALLHADPHVTFAPNYNPFDAIAGGASSAVRAVQTVTEQFKLNKLDSTDASKATNEFFDSIRKNSGLTAQEFDKLNQEAPTFAQALSKAFGASNIYDFLQTLAKASIPIEQVLQTILKMGPTTDSQFKQAQASTHSFGDAVDDLQKSFKDMWAEISGGEQPVDTVSSLIRKLSDGFKALPEWLKSNSISDAINKWFDSDSMSKAFEEFSHNVLADLDTYIVQPIMRWFDSTSISDAVGAWAQANIVDPITRAIQSAASAIAGSASGGGNDMGLSGAGSLSPTSGGSGGAADSGIQLSGGASTDNLPAFATGGSFTVGGAGGTDTTPVSFMATAGEVVTVSTPDQLQSGSAVAATSAVSSGASVKQITDAIDQSTIDISKQVMAGSDQIVSALNKLTGGVAATTVNPSTGLPVASTGTAIGSLANAQAGAVWINGFGWIGGTGTGSGGGGGGGGGGGIKQDPNDVARAKAMAQYEQAYQKAQNTPGIDYMYAHGLANTVRSRGTSSLGPGGIPRNPASTIPINSGFYGGSPYGPEAPPYYGYGTGYGSIGQSGGYGDPYATGTSAYNDYGYGFGTGDFGTGGSTVGDVANQYMGSGGSSYTSGGWGFDPNANSYGGGSVDAGYFATGGSFTVPGSGGIDKTLLKMHVTPGEGVTVTPNGVSMPALADPSSQSSAATSMTKNITINVAGPVQAQDFIRSRAQIARGL